MDAAHGDVAMAKRGENGLTISRSHLPLHQRVPEYPGRKTMYHTE